MIVTVTENLALGKSVWITRRAVPAKAGWVQAEGSSQPASQPCRLPGLPPHGLTFLPGPPLLARVPEEEARPLPGLLLQMKTSRACTEGLPRKSPGRLRLVGAQGCLPFSSCACRLLFRYSDGRWGGGKRT